MVMPIEIEAYATYRRDVLLREAATDRLVRRSSPPIRLGRIGLAAILRTVASYLEGDGHPSAGRPVPAAR
jgi:hypothetical protein